MITNDVARLSSGPHASGCYAALLTPQGRIVVDLHVLLRPEELWLELPCAEIPGVRERLAKLIIADNVKLLDRSRELGRLGIEGPEAPALVGEVVAPGDRERVAMLSPDAGVEARIAGVDVLLAAFGWTGERALQVFTPGDGAMRARVRDALVEAGSHHGLIPADDEVLEILRVEAGVPTLHAELSLEVLPPEARLERAISYTKGCYTGQEIIARLRSRGQVAHLLVGVVVEAAEPPRQDEVVEVSGEAVGEVTSAVRSPTAGPIALAFVRRAQAEPGTRVRIGGNPGRVVALPFVSAAPVATP
jgi:folate-binding protein YgfZ